MRWLDSVTAYHLLLGLGDQLSLSVLLSIPKIHKTKLTLPFDENLKSVSTQDVKETGMGGDKAQESVWTLDKAFLKS